ncbi:SOS response-associated peptidase [Oceanomicrobium pacificus]|uniref:Abasic site processing protein n=1 Tax=Oceanomicrobium pacificus TaxID=2692916 RepID=A0A6B0TRQ7_9RHOB|nr:SOS response-associated peptidase [Oceanomicrobium pacificus]MXU65399.1 SOS response-associated peptidase [Oceanomicrobium pacificus]
MCGRFAMTLPVDAMAGLFDAVPDPVAAEIPVPRYNVSPTQTIPVVTGDADAGRRIEPLRWGFIPHWYKTKSDGPLLINARAETLAEKPAFRKSARSRRCIIPASGFYEWKRAGDGGKQPFYMRDAQAPLLAMAGIWRDWTDAEGQVTRSCAIVTCAANKAMADLHHRMPVLLAASDYGLWLGEEGHGAARLMVPAPEDQLLFEEADRALNGARVDRPFTSSQAAAETAGRAEG